MDGDAFLRKLGSLNVARSSKGLYSAGKAPHKPLLLISLMILDKHGRVDFRDIRPDSHLKEVWDSLWSVLDYSKPGPIALPLFHMRSEGFWKLDLETPFSSPPSLQALSGSLRRLSLDEAAIGVLQDPEGRNAALNALLQEGGYFTPEEMGRLRARMEDLDDSFVYEESLVQELSREFRMDWSVDVIADKAFYAATKRDPAFRRLVIDAYGDSCAVCGLRLSTSSGVSVLDAAHILPFNRFKNDDVRNGLCLCKTHHWLFDRGVISADESYRIQVSGGVEDEWPEKAFTGLRSRRLSLPSREDEHPSGLALRWHCENVFTES